VQEIESGEEVEFTGHALHVRTSLMEVVKVFAAQTQLVYPSGFTSPVAQLSHFPPVEKYLFSGQVHTVEPEEEVEFVGHELQV